MTFFRVSHQQASNYVCLRLTIVAMRAHNGGLHNHTICPHSNSQKITVLHDACSEQTLRDEGPPLGFAFRSLCLVPPCLSIIP